MRIIAGLALAITAAAGSAAAQAPRPAPAVQRSPEPSIVPAPDWVEPVAIGSPDPALGDRPVQLLLSNSQSLYGSDHIDHYVSLAFLIQNAQGLQGLGNVVLPWPPERADLLVHKVQIIRNGTVIDLLANGQRFTVLRRENNLESAMLDGMLTAVMQPDGLAVGDILSVSWTLRLRGGTLPLRGENLFALPDGQPIRHFNIRQIWPAAVPIRWRGTGAFERAAVRTTPRGTELSIDLTDALGPHPPAQVPTRLLTPSTLQVSQYRDWAEISALVAPHYEAAERLGAASPLQAEIARIAAASADPRLRTMAALRLVQDQVRYFALVMGEGNYLPASAEQSWTRRYADCKGKAVLLVALLRGLGIEAEPVLVNNEAGDSLSERLPMMALFNHMVVRARIDGRSYWLDGTRSGDRALDDLASSTFGWGLPIRSAGAALEPLPFAPPSRPLAELNLVYDGSAGLDGPIPARIEEVFRGDPAVQMRLLVAQFGRDEFLRRMRETLTSAPEGITLSEFDLRDDPEAGTFTLIATGRTTLSWNPVPGTVPAGGPRRFRFGNEVLAMSIDVERPEGPFHDAPVALPVPAYGASTETVILPAGGRGFSIDGADFERVIAGTRLSRRISIANGRATARSELRRVEREISAAVARDSAAQLRRLGNDRAYLQAPADALHAAAGRR